MNVELTGDWRAAAADEGLRRRFADAALVDDDWPLVDVPGHWRSTRAFAAHDGPVLYRHRFGSAPLGRDRRRWLTFEGIFYMGDVFLDGAYLGNTEGYFAPHTFELTDAVRERDEHLLAVEVACAPQPDGRAKRNITGVFQHWDCGDPDWNPGGIWRPVRVRDTGPTCIRTLRVACAEATSERAVLRLRATLDASEPGTVAVRTTVGDAADAVEEHQLAAGANNVAWSIIVERPRLWWPRALGDQPLYDVTVDVDGSDVATRRVGLRQVRMKRWVVSVNDERLFLKGSNLGPTQLALGDATPEQIAADVDLAVDAGLDLLRLTAHISRPELYDAADERGLLLWQDFPLHRGYARGVRKQAARQAEAAVDLLAHHPSIAVWCGHNEPIAVEGVPTAAKFVALQELPTWNKSVLDASVKRAFERHDGTRPVVPHSGVLPHPGSGGTDTHLYFGWHYGDERDLPGFCAAFPRMVRFVSEFGAPAVPEPADGTGPDPTQRYQATLIKHHIETLRRLKYRPTGGFCQFLFADCYPAVTPSVLDHARTAKLGFRALADACAPVIVVADRPDAEYKPGDAIALDVHVVNDLRVRVDDGVVRATVAWPGGAQEWRWGGDVPADDCVRVSRIELSAPDTPGPVTIALTLTSADVKASNSYETVIVAEP